MEVKAIIDKRYGKKSWMKIYGCVTIVALLPLSFHIACRCLHHMFLNQSSTTSYGMVLYAIMKDEYVWFWHLIIYTTIDWFYFHSKK